MIWNGIVIAASITGVFSAMGVIAFLIVNKLFSDTPKPSGYHGRN